jgi:predicted nucleic acid-binding protein
MPTGRWAVFDTSVYISAIRGGLGSLAYERLSSRLPRTYLASVVSAELRAGATNEGARRLVDQFTRWAHRVGRMVTPSAATWERAGDILGKIRVSEARHRSKLPTLWNDLLIALSARQIGATLVAENVQDFELLRRHVRFDLEVVS